VTASIRLGSLLVQPYPFVDVAKIGYPLAMRNLAVVIVLLLAVGAVYVWLDRRLHRTSPIRAT